MRIRSAAVVLCAAAALLTACEPGDAGSSPAPSGKGATATSATSKAATSAAVPRFVGMGLQSAQDAAQAAGFRDLTSHDSAGRDRKQLFDRNWKVCGQNVAAGRTVSVGTKLDFGAVKLTESCPAHDQTPPAKAGKAMPNFVGEALSTARKALPGNTSVTTDDATGNRFILVESNWKVCAQDPKPGTALTGQPVKFTAVKFGENC